MSQPTGSSVSISVPRSSFTVHGYKFSVINDGGSRPGREELEDIARGFAEAKDFLRLLKRGVRLKNGVVPETPLQIKLVSGLSGNKAGLYKSSTNTITYERNPSIMTILHELEHAVDDFKAYKNVNNDTTFASSKRGHEIHKNPMSKACKASGLGRFRELTSRDLDGRPLSEAQKKELKQLDKKFRRRGAIRGYFCYDTQEKVATYGHYISKSHMAAALKIIKERLGNKNFSTARKKKLCDDLVFYLNSGSPVVKEKVAKVFVETIFRKDGASHSIASYVMNKILKKWSKKAFSPDHMAWKMEYFLALLLDPKVPKELKSQLKVNELVGQGTEEGKSYFEASLVARLLKDWDKVTPQTIKLFGKMVRKFNFRQPSLVFLKHLAQIKGGENELIKCIYHAGSHFGEETKREYGKTLLELGKPLSANVLKAIAIISPNTDDTLKAIDRLLASAKSEKQMIDVLKYGKNRRWKDWFMDKVVKKIFADPSKQSVKLLSEAVMASPYRSNVIEGFPLILARKGADQEVKKLIEYARRNFKPATQILMKSMYAVKSGDWKNINSLLGEAVRIDIDEKNKKTYFVEQVCKIILSADLKKLPAQTRVSILSAVFKYSRLIKTSSEAMKRIAEIKGADQEIAKLLQYAEENYNKAAKTRYAKLVLSLKKELSVPVLAIITRMAPEYRETIKAFRRLVKKTGSGKQIVNLLWYARENKWSDNTQAKMAKIVFAMHSKVSADVLIGAIKYAFYQDDVIKGLRLLLKRKDAEMHVRTVLAYTKTYFGKDKDMYKKIHNVLEPHEIKWALSSKSIKRVEDLIKSRGGKKGYDFEERLSKKALRYGGKKDQLPPELLAVLVGKFYYVRPSVRVLKHLVRRKNSEAALQNCFTYALQHHGKSSQISTAKIILKSKNNYSLKFLTMIAKFTPDWGVIQKAFKKLVGSPKAYQKVEEVLKYAKRRKWSSEQREKMVKSVFKASDKVSAAIIRVATELGPYQRNVMTGLKILMGRRDGQAELQKFVEYAKRKFGREMNEKINKFLGGAPSSVTIETHAVPQFMS